MSPAARRVGVTLAGAALVAGAAAAQVPIRAAGAGGRFQTAHDPKTRTLRFAAPVVAAFRRGFDPLVARMEAMPSVNQPSAPLCMRSSTWIEVESELAVQASLDLHRPINAGGRCILATTEGVAVVINRLSMLTAKEEARDDAGPDWWRLPITDMTPEGFALVEGGQRFQVFTHARAPLLRTVTMGRYIQRRLARPDSLPNDPAVAARVRAPLPSRTVTLADGADDVRAMRQALSAAELAQPACVVPPGGAYTVAADCPPENRLFEPNPDYFDPRTPEAIQLVVLQTPDRQQRGESEVEAAERLRIWDAIDRFALRRDIR